jgi:hypothetical protein
VDRSIHDNRVRRRAILDADLIAVKSEAREHKAERSSLRSVGARFSFTNPICRLYLSGNRWRASRGGLLKRRHDQRDAAERETP